VITISTHFNRFIENDRRSKKMKRQIDTGKIFDISDRFNKLKDKVWEERHADIIEDGILDVNLYANATTRILWVLKQDYYDSGAMERTYRERILAAARTGNLSLTWKRMAQVSYGILTKTKEFSALPNLYECGKVLLATAIIESDKELGESRSDNSVVLDGFNYYRQLVMDQIDAYDPDVIIVGMNEQLKMIPGEIYCHIAGYDSYAEELYNAEWDNGDNVAASCIKGKVLLWVSHPQATKDIYGGITDELYFTNIVKRYLACKGQCVE
jgi:hypothetical protein